jgi:transposase InsO family protein
MNCDEYAELPPAQIWARELDAGRYHCSVSTMYRILREKGQSGERRRQATHPARTVPELVTTGPSQVFTWDITKAAGPVKGVWYHAYVIIDIFSRYIVGHTVEAAESAERAEELIRETIARNGIVPETVHADRGTSMTSKKVSQLLIDLGVTRSHSRPKVSNDNPYSEAQFKTTKYMSTIPNGSIRWPMPASGSRRSSRTTTTSTGIRASAGTHPPPCTSAPPRKSETSEPSPSPRHTPATPNASAAAPGHPGYPSRHGSTTRPSAASPHHKPHSVTTVSLDLKSSAAPANKVYVACSWEMSTRTQRWRNCMAKASRLICSGSRGAKERASPWCLIPPKPATSAVQVPASEAICRPSRVICAQGWPGPSSRLRRGSRMPGAAGRPRRPSQPDCRRTARSPGQ